DGGRRESLCFDLQTIFGRSQTAEVETPRRIGRDVVLNTRAEIGDGNGRCWDAGAGRICDHAAYAAVELRTGSQTETEERKNKRSQSEERLSAPSLASWADR